jgi:hypothetical protein
MEVTLNIPALFAESDEIGPEDIDHLQLPSLKKILSRSRSLDIAGRPYELWLFEQFTGSTGEAGKLPVASLTASMDGLQGDQGWWMRADPVFLYPDTHSLILRDPRQLNLTFDERDAIADSIRPLLEDYHATLHTPATTRWYLHFEDAPPQLDCTPLHDVLMQPVNDFLPSGPDSRRWHTLFNEIQMVLNRLSVNESREYYGLPPVNSLWFWGPGKSPTKTGAIYDCCIGGDDYVKALCRHASNRHKPLDDGIGVSRYQDNALVVDERLLQARRLNDPQQWLQDLQQLETQILTPLIRALRQGDIHHLRLLSDSNRQFECTSMGLRKFWKPARPVSSFLLQ